MDPSIAASLMLDGVRRFLYPWASSIDAQVVDPGRLERDARVFGRIELGFEPFLGAQHRLFQPLDRQLVAFFRRVDPLPHLGELAAHVVLLLSGAEREALERGPGHDDAVPGAGGAAGGELAAPVPLQVFLPGGQHLSLGVELEPFPGELLQHVVGDHDGGLADQAEAAQFGDADDHLGGFPGADLMGEQDGGLVDHPGDGRDLVRPGPEGQGQAGQGQRGVVVAAQHQAVEPVVVGAGQRGGTGRVLPGPVGEPAGQLGGLLLRGQGGVDVEDGPVVARGVADRVVDLDAALFEHGLGEVGGGVAAGAPGGPGQHGVRAAADRPDLAAGMLHAQVRVIEQVPQELLDVPGVDPGRAGSRVDLAGGEIGRDHPAQFGDVDREPGVVLGGALGVAQLVAYFPGEVLGGGHDMPGGRVVEDQRAELLAGIVLGRAEQPGDFLQPYFAASVQADGQRVGGGVGAEPRGPRGDDAYPEDGRLGGPLADRVELLQRVHQRGERVAPEPALPRPDPRHHRLAGGRVGPAGAPHREPVHRPVGGQVSVVAAPELGAAAHRSPPCPRRRRPRPRAGPARSLAAPAGASVRPPGWPARHAAARRRTRPW